MLSILISSTFNDMQAERDVIRSRVAPALRRIAARYGQSVRLIDLRWGVNTADLSEAEASQKVLGACLDEIDRCDGYMICLLGNRYGWIPDYSKVTTIEEHGIRLSRPISVTELEIQYGILRRNKGEKAVVFLRDEVSGLPNELLEQYCDPPENHAMAALKAQLEALPEVRCQHYSLEYGEDGEFRGINAFAERLIEKASDLLHKVLGAEEKLEEGELLKRKFDHLIEEQTETYLPDPTVEEAVASFKEESDSILILQGTEGTGRTALICRLTKSPPDGVRVIPFFCAEKQTGRDILSYFIHRLSRREETISFHPGTPQIQLEECFSELLSHVEEPLWLAVDGLEFLDGDVHSRLSWLPMHLPDNIRFVLTTVNHDSACNQLGESFAVKYFRMPPVPDAVTFLRAGLAAAGKAVPEETLIKIAAHPLSTNYLFCDMVIRMLMLMDRHDFAVMNRDGGGIEAINAYILAKIRNLPQTMGEMAFLFLYDCGEQITPGNTAQFLSAIAQAPMGLRAQDLQAIFPEDWDEAEFSYFTAFLDGFLVCDDRGCYTFPSAVMQRACFYVGGADLLEKIASYFATLPDDDPVKTGSALPMFLACNMCEEAGTLLLANSQLKRLYIQLWNMLDNTEATVTALLNRDDILAIFLANGIDLCEDRVRLRALAEILKFRTPPENRDLYRALLSGLAQLQICCENKRGAYDTLSVLLAMEDAPLARARVMVRMTECAFVDRVDQIDGITKLLEEGLSLFPQEDSLSSGDTLLLYKGVFYRYLMTLQDAIGVKIHGVWTYEEYASGKNRNSSVWPYVETLVKIGINSSYRKWSGEDVFRILIHMCSLGEKLGAHLSGDGELRTSFAELFFNLLKVMKKVDSPEDPFNENLSPRGSRLLEEFREQRSALIVGTHSLVLEALRGRYDAPMLKTLAYLQIHLAVFSEDDAQRRARLEQSTRILLRYFSAEPLSEFAEELEKALLNLADCYLSAGDITAYEDTLEKWGGIALTRIRHAIQTAMKKCHRYPDEIHGTELARERQGMSRVWLEYCQRLWLRELYELKNNVDLILAIYRNNNRHQIHMSVPADLINIRTGLVLVRKIMELETLFEDPTLTEQQQRTLPVAFHSLLATALEVILLSEQNLKEDSEDVLSTPRFYYSKTAAFVESYIRRCKERNLDIAPDTILRLSFRLAQLKVKAVPYCDEPREELEETLSLLDTLMGRLPVEPMPSDWLMDGVSENGIRRLQCQIRILQGEFREAEGDTEGAALYYKQACLLCGALYAADTASREQKTMALEYLRRALPPLMTCYERLGTEGEYVNLWNLLGPLFEG